MFFTLPVRLQGTTPNWVRSRMKIAIRFFILIGWMIGLFACQNAGTGGSSNGDGFPSQKTGSNWRLSLTASIPDSAADSGIAYNRLVAGQDLDATDGFDNSFDVRALLIGSVGAYFDHTTEPIYDSQSAKIWSDVRADGLPQDWNFVVAVDSVAPVTLKWTLPTGEINCVTNKFVLTDQDGSGGATDMCATGSLAYTANGPARHFVLRVS
jgi:hypothetical protein